MKKINTPHLDAEEQEILRAFEAGETAALPDKEKARVFAALQTSAKNTLAKTRSITLRISELDLHRLKVKAQQEGIPYQTYVTHLLHRGGQGVIGA